MKKYSALALLFISAFVFGGCSSKQTDSATTGNGGEAVVSKEGFDERGRRMPDFGQPAEDADLRGLVTSIVGNEVTILKIERPQMGTGAGSDRDNVNDKTADSETAKTVGFGTGTGGRMPGMGGGMRPGGGTDAESQAAMLERMKEMSTGEEKIIIPVGIRMLKSDMNEGEEPKMVEASLADIKSNSMITVWLDQNVTDKKSASFVMIMR